MGVFLHLCNVFFNFINNLGPGLGAVSENYSSINTLSKTVLAFAMLLGRLEIFTLLVILTPMFWSK